MKFHEAVIYIIASWIVYKIVTYDGPSMEADAWRRISELCKHAAEFAGRCGLAAEAQHYEIINSGRLS